MSLNYIQDNFWLVITLILWELVWKGIAMWKAAEHKQRYWFFALLIINTVGVLPILYLTFFQGKKLENFKWHPAV